VGQNGAAGSGAITLTGGTLGFAGSGLVVENAIVSAAGTGPANIDTTSIGGSGIVTLNGVLSGGDFRFVSTVPAGSFPPTVTLTAANSHGATIVDGDTFLILSGNGTLGTGGVALNGLNAVLGLNTAGVTTVGNAISGIGNIQRMGSGTTILAGNNSHKGGFCSAAVRSWPGAKPLWARARSASSALRRLT
jgi:hypothetical protein